MCKAVSKGTPLPSKVPKERVNKVRLYLRTSLPSKGVCRALACVHCCPPGDCIQRRTSQNSASKTKAITGAYSVKALPTTITKRVGAGSASPMSLNRVSNWGTTKPSMATSEMMATPSRMQG